MMENERYLKRKLLDRDAPQTKDDFLCTVTHDVYVNLFNSAQKYNTKLEPTLDDFSINKNSWKTDYPYPMFRPKAFDLKDDVCTDLVKRKGEYKHTLCRFRSIHQKEASKGLTKPLLTSKTPLYLPSYFTHLATGEVSDPDPYFDAKYDYYFTGGTLSTINVKGDNYIIRPLATNKICLTNVRTSHSHYVQTTSQVHNIYSYESKNNYLFTLRNKYSLSLHKILSPNNIKIIWNRESKKIPFIDFKYYNNKGASIDVKTDFILSDLFEEKDVVSYKLPHEGLVQFEFKNDNELLFFGQSAFHLLDLRSMDKISGNFNNNRKFECDKFSSLSPFDKESDYIYCSSLHNIRKIDLRQMKVVKKWNHLLQMPPHVTKIYKDDSEKAVVAANFHEIILMRISEEENYFPYKLWTPLETLHNSNLKKRFHNDENLYKRLSYSLNGIDSIDGDGIYNCNSLGDVFFHKVTNNEPRDDEGIKKLNSWINLLPTEEKPLTVTDFIEMSEVKNLITKKLKIFDLGYMTESTKCEINDKFGKIPHPMREIWYTEGDGINKVNAWLKTSKEEYSEEEESEEDTDNDDDDEGNKDDGFDAKAKEEIKMEEDFYNIFFNN